ncbi:hypothetical protein [Amycolatopsis anabasis]|uniref:hypothetical protein n=1 Tax=Amycolatopsis anabasis TaxID=1840409 RepID=UPI00131D0A7A|nr:hypothetical protein [Amycolatopsis anabasis]
MTLLKRSLRKALLVRTPENPDRSAPTVSDNTTVYFMVKCRPGTSAETFVRQMLSSVASRVHNKRKVLNYSSFRQYHNTKPGGLDALPLILTRTHRVVRSLCLLSDIAPPPVFSMNLTPYYDALIEFEFEDSPTDDQFAALELVGEIVESICGEVVTCECDKRYTIIGHPAPTRKPDSVFLTVITKTPWNRTMRQAQKYWIEQHAPIVVDNNEYLNLRGYQQVHTTTREESRLANEYSGVAFIEFGSISEFWRNNLTYDAMRINNTLALDEINLTIGSHINMFRCFDLS